MSAINISTNNFQKEVMNSDKPVLLGTLVCTLPYGSSNHRGDCRGTV